MQRKKLLVACLSLLLAGLVIPSVNIPRAHAFASSITVTLSGVGVSGFRDPHTGVTMDGIAAGSTLTVTVAVVASSFVPSYQRNITIGFKGDWMSQYQNASSASPASTMALVSSQQGTATISVAIPSNAGTTAHSWSVAIWDGKANSVNAADCFTGNNPEDNAPGDTSCYLISYNTNNNVAVANYHQLAFYTPDQLSGAQTRIQASNIVSSVGGSITLLTNNRLAPAPGTTAAAGQIAQASTEMTLGDQSWQNGDYAGAKTHYQNALNDANAAAGDLTGQGGGVDTASLVNLLLGGAGVAMIGIGGLLAGIGAFGYLRKKPKA